MDEKFYIPKQRTLDPSQDFAFLRAEGIKYIERLSSSLWTDYNTHDPGITILEALCYAITELGYRASFDMKDLLADTEGRTYIHQAFFTARKILTNAPLTAADYRKILIDEPGVANAWMVPYIDTDGQTRGHGLQEMAFFANCKEDRLTYTSTEHPIEVNGLYEARIDLEMSPEFGDMNTGDVVYVFNEIELYGKKIRAVLPDWDEADHAFLKTYYNDTITKIELSPRNPKSNKDGWKVTLYWGTKSFSYDIVLQGLRESKEVMDELETELKEKTHHRSILRLYYKKIITQKRLFREIRRKLHAHRNLCEDFVKISTVPADTIAFCADIDVKPDADLEQIMAQVYFEIEQYLHPPVTFYSLEEQYKKGKSTEEIFTGPRLLHGFIDDEELEDAQLRSVVYVSDIINRIMDIEGVLSVRNTMLTRYNRYGLPELPSAPWCLNVKENHKPVLDTDHSKIIFFKNKLPFQADPVETGDALKLLNATVLQNKLYRYAGDPEVPAGTYYALNEYLSVQYEFPETYALGENALPDTAGNERKAQAAQLKGYLLFFDQLLADFMQQLSEAKRLLSVDTALDKTYFNRFIEDENVGSGIFTNASSLEKVLHASSYGTDADAVARQKLIEDKTTYYQRRNRFLDHLISRFAENFNDYVLMLYSSYGNSPVQKSEQEIVDDKIRFIKDYPKISSRRGAAFDYHNGKLWDARNVSGLEHRIARLSGINNFYRRYLYCMRHVEFESSGTEPETYFFKIRDTEGNIILKSVKNYLVNAEIYKIVQQVIAKAGEQANYKILNPSAGAFKLALYHGADAIAEGAGIFSTQALAQKALNDFTAAFNSACDVEGLHLLEHILLRPRFKVPDKDNNGNAQQQGDYQLMQVCLNDDCQFCGEQDPYSFRASVVLPYWPEKFKDLNFRQFFEDSIRKEAPAHVLLKICWLSNNLMLDFEIAYRHWLTALQNHSKELPFATDDTKNKLIKANNELVKILKQLHSEYPEARLHDCDTGETIPVVLNNTILGSF